MEQSCYLLLRVCVSSGALVLLTITRLVELWRGGTGTEEEVEGEADWGVCNWWREYEIQHTSYLDDMCTCTLYMYMYVYTCTRTGVLTL